LDRSTLPDPLAFLPKEKTIGINIFYVVLSGRCHGMGRITLALKLFFLKKKPLVSTFFM
jgi:hypothetical protein